MNEKRRFDARIYFLIILVVFVSGLFFSYNNFDKSEVVVGEVSKSPQIEGKVSQAFDDGGMEETGEFENNVPVDAEFTKFIESSDTSLFTQSRVPELIDETTGESIPLSSEGKFPQEEFAPGSYRNTKRKAISQCCKQFEL